ncbi:GAF sensor signal transduction histidine kinase [Desulforamulus reducens MI-1]|uniref:histidine kinase n=1 Tax=Desulforamulus reducens (strain ATCC BAA-1160 / DSM 100696 / MI-1) TaxID=349161 RepID=A4J4M7_DESRM|nr:ATP-binding protein [Desulforamulus reducens]ABO50030.1 GAF sensor signal transduction histidine kinase [Desulforamulus reducens MI-1]
MVKFEKNEELLNKLIGVRSTRLNHYVELRKTIEEMTKQNKRLEIINEIARSITVAMSYDEIIERTAEPLKEVIPYDLLSFCLLEGDQLVIKSGIPKEQVILGVGTVLPRENSAPWKAMREKKCFLRQNIWQDPEKYGEDRDLRKVGIRSAIMAPLLIQDNVIGTLNFGSNKTEAYSQKDFVFVQQLADQLAVCLQNSSLYGEVLKSQREWEATFRAVPDTLFTIDLDFTIMNINKVEVKGVHYRQLLGKKCYEVFGKDHKQCNPCPARNAFTTGKPANELITHTPDKIMDTFAYPLFDENGQTVGLVIYISDVTERIHIQSQLVQSAKLAAVGEMAAGVAHELNSPLTAILGDSQLLLRKFGQEHASYPMLVDIKNCGTRCKRIIQNLLAFSRQEQYHNESVCLNQVVENSLALVSYQIEKTNIRIKTNIHQELSPILGNKQQLEQVVVNFLLNAKDALYGDPAGIITITTGSLPKDSEVNEVFISVKDNGCGIEQSNISKIFNPFFTTKENFKGTGLGLSVSLGIAQSHGGRIVVQSELGQGSTFSLIIPAGQKGEKND